MVSFTYTSPNENIADYKIKLVDGLQQSLQLIHISTNKVMDFISLKEPIRSMNSIWFNHNIIISEFEATDYPISEWKDRKALHDKIYRPIPVIDFIIDHNDRIISKYNQTIDYLMKAN